MENKLFLQWTVENWITVLLMVFVSMALIGMISSAFRHYSGSAQLASSATGT